MSPGASAQDTSRRVTRVAVLDDHPTVLAGLRTLLDGVTDLQPVAAADTAQALSRQLDTTRADVVIVDYDLARGDGLMFCQQLKQRICPPAVVIYSAYAGRLTISARIAGADALVDKRAPASELLNAVRRTAAGEAVMPDVPHELREAAFAQLAPSDVPVASMLLAGTSHQGIAETLAIDRRDVIQRTQRVVARLRPKSGGNDAPTIATTTSAATAPATDRQGSDAVLSVRT
jgi:DNA-binding NarL/FixJ family response regulator